MYVLKTPPINLNPAGLKLIFVVLGSCILQSMPSIPDFRPRTKLWRRISVTWKRDYITLRRRMRRAGNILSRFLGERVHRRDAIPGIDKNITRQEAQKKRILRRKFRDHKPLRRLWWDRTSILGKLPTISSYSTLPDIQINECPWSANPLRIASVAEQVRKEITSPYYFNDDPSSYIYELMYIGKASKRLWNYQSWCQNLESTQFNYSSNAELNRSWIQPSSTLAGPIRPRRNPI